MYEQGNRQAGYAKLLRLAELYGCTVDDFFSDGHDPAAARLQRLEERVAKLERELERGPRPRSHDGRSRVRGSDPAARGF